MLCFIFSLQTWNGCVATIRESSDDSTWGVLWKLKCKDLASLDAQEGVESNHYKRFTIEVRFQAYSRSLRLMTTLQWHLQENNEPACSCHKNNDHVLQVVKRSGRFVENYPAYTYELTESQLGTCSEGPSITYKDIVVAGASEHNIPLPYISFLKNIKDNGKHGGGPLANASGHAEAMTFGMGLAIVLNRMAV